MRPRALVRVLVCLVVTFMSFGQSLALSADVAPTSLWTRVASPPFKIGQIEGISALSSNDIWAVGGSMHSDDALIEHWDGIAWSIVPSPRTPGMSPRLTSVAAVSSSNVWAVGKFIYPHDATLIEHWDGTSWAIVPSVEPPEKVYNLKMTGVAAITEDDIWAVGYYEDFTRNFRQRVFAEHWNGDAWSYVALPHPNNAEAGSPTIEAITAISTDNIWVVGAIDTGSHANLSSALIEHWDGRSWMIIPSPEVQGAALTLTGVSAMSGTDIWAVGYTGSYFVLGPHTGFVEHWDGITWTVISLPDFPVPQIHFTTVGVLQSNDVWIAGYGGTYRPEADVVKEDIDYLILHWDGASWSTFVGSDFGVTRTYDTAHTERINRLAIINQDDVWFAGYFSTTGDSYLHFTRS